MWTILNCWLEADDDHLLDGINLNNDQLFLSERERGKQVFKNQVKHTVSQARRTVRAIASERCLFDNSAKISSLLELSRFFLLNKVHCFPVIEMTQ